MRRVLRSKSRSEGRAISTALSYTGFVHCTLTPKTTGKASHSTGHISYLQACASRGPAPREREKHCSSSKGWVLKEAGETPRNLGEPPTPGSPKPIPSACASRSHSWWFLQRPREGPGAGSVLQEQPGGAVPASPASPAAAPSRSPQAVPAAEPLHEVTAKSRGCEGCPAPSLPGAGGIC